MASTASANGLVSLRLRAIACTSVVRSFINIRSRVYGDDFRDTSYIASRVLWLRAAGQGRGRGARARTWGPGAYAGPGTRERGATPGTRGRHATPGAWNWGARSWTLAG